MRPWKLGKKEKEDPKITFSLLFGHGDKPSENFL